MSLDVIEDLVQVYRGSLPLDLTTDQIGVDIAYTIATMMSRSEEEITAYVNGARLSTATGLFLDQHARDRGLRRQDGETDDQLRDRLRTPPKAGTVTAITDAINQILGTDDELYLIELPKDSLYFDRAHKSVLNIRPMFLTRGSLMGGGRGVVVALIPQSADALESVSDALRTKVSAGKLWLVMEYT